MRETVRRVDQVRDVIDAQNLREATRRLRVRRVVQRVPAPQGLHKEEAQRRHVEPDRARRQFPFAQQVRLIRAEMILIQVVR
jgi:phosphatidylserine/phosphatidylglycerophosphate/cardiolipin synthase-like enzyme